MNTDLLENGCDFASYFTLTGTEVAEGFLILLSQKTTEEFPL